MKNGRIGFEKELLATGGGPVRQFISAGFDCIANLLNAEDKAGMGISSAGGSGRNS
jgi:hypothetical protein